MCCTDIHTYKNGCVRVLHYTSDSTLCLSVGNVMFYVILNTRQQNFQLHVQYVMHILHTVGLAHNNALVLLCVYICVCVCVTVEEWLSGTGRCE